MAEENVRVLLQDQVGVGVNDDGQVVISLDYPELPGVHKKFRLAWVMPPDQAREVAASILRAVAKASQ